MTSNLIHLSLAASRSPASTQMPPSAPDVLRGSIAAAAAVDASIWTFTIAPVGATIKRRGLRPVIDAGLGIA